VPDLQDLGNNGKKKERGFLRLINPSVHPNSQTETTKQTTLHYMLDSDGSVHLETNGLSSIPLNLRLRLSLEADTTHLSRQR
jgi:hypothetical protein